MSPWLTDVLRKTLRWYKKEKVGERSGSVFVNCIKICLLDKLLERCQSG